jgi:hypothetical protein
MLEGEPTAQNRIYFLPSKSIMSKRMTDNCKQYILGSHEKPEGK